VGRPYSEVRATDDGACNVIGEVRKENRDKMYGGNRMVKLKFADRGSNSNPTPLHSHKVRMKGRAQKAKQAWEAKDSKDLESVQLGREKSMPSDGGVGYA